MISLGAVAMRQGVTPRYIQFLFEAAGTTFTAYPFGQRLDAAHRMRSDPSYANWTIKHRPREAGFGDLSHFNRSFKSRLAPFHLRLVSDRARVERAAVRSCTEEGRARCVAGFANRPETQSQGKRRSALVLTVPNQLGVAYNAHLIEAILAHVAPALGWR